VLSSAFEIAFVDTGDPEGFDDIGRFGWNNVRMALRHGRQCLGLLVRRRPDAVYIPIARGLWGFVRDLLYIVPARLFCARVIVHLRAGRFDLVHDNGAIGRAIARIGLALADRALVLGESVRDVYGAAVDPARVRIVPNGMLLDGWSAAEWAARRHAGSSIEIAYVANLFHDKGIHVMIEALGVLRQRGVDARVTFGGDWGSATYREECLARVAALGLDDVVSFVGRVDDDGKRALLARSDVAVFVPVRPEGLPWVVLEAMAAGLPVVATPQGTIPELVVDDDSGYLVAIGDAGELAARLEELAGDAEARRAMGQRGRRRIEDVYEESKTHAALVGVILESIERR
jgi:glycosyltransferase involved in cell wall biosynthesis